MCFDDNPCILTYFCTGSVHPRVSFTRAAPALTVAYLRCRILYTGDNFWHCSRLHNKKSRCGFLCNHFTKTWLQAHSLLPYTPATPRNELCSSHTPDSHVADDLVRILVTRRAKVAGTCHVKLCSVHMTLFTRGHCRVVMGVEPTKTFIAHADYDDHQHDTPDRTASGNPYPCWNGFTGRRSFCNWGWGCDWWRGCYRHDCSSLHVYRRCRDGLF